MTRGQIVARLGAPTLYGMAGLMARAQRGFRIQLPGPPHDRSTTDSISRTGRRLVLYPRYSAMCGG
ncbi:hypothetical protein JOF56_009487 [Kibdelosporangium banguiense]|uniref:Uncharacterized protein n=1 Tax=Kibdelosporangium banguiense TaxID=1365924 RepID=A0ABS4TXH7_9PSEU|nr:hypothetical protein [Kibdelosporangium banguiense]MBP2329102.1 hypothetical protein [Kibdelosporangium banguiense]